MNQIHLDMVRVTEAGAVAAAAYVGRGDKIAADRAATEAMRDRLNKIDFAGSIVIGEGKKDDAPGLFRGERVGAEIDRHLRSHQTYDIAIDPIEGTTPTAKGGTEAMSVIALGCNGCLFSSENFYMKKIAVGSKVARHIPKGDLLQMPVDLLVEYVKDTTNKTVEQITFCVLDRPRHEGLIKSIRHLGCRIKLISDCDVSGAIATCSPESGIDVYMGIGGAPEGVISAVALKCMRGYFEGQLVDCGKDGLHVPCSKVYNMDELAKGDVVFCATGITDGSLLRGVRYPDGRPHTHSILMRSESGTVRRIEAFHGN